MQTKNTIFLILFIMTILIKTDVPVKCPRDMIDGDWTFRISREMFQPDLSNIKTSCTHGFPDKIDQTQGDHDYSFSSFVDINITLKGDYKVYQNGVEVGTWTPVYNEGFILYYRNSQFTTFMKYFKDGEGFQSNCDKTMIGWHVPDVANKNKNWSCFFGFKSKIKNYGTSFIQVKKFISKIKKNISTKRNHIFLRTSPVLLQKKSKLRQNLKYEDQKDFVNEINNRNGLTWTADFNEEFIGLSFLQLNEHLGSKNKFSRSTSNDNSNEDEYIKELHLKAKDKMAKSRKSKIPTTSVKDKDSKDTKDYAETSKYIETEIDDISVDSLPTNWDWRDVGGVNYVPSPKKQGSCGSCYVFSSVSSLEARLRVLTNNEDKTTFSKQYVLSCNPYTEGCEGGYPILVGKFLSEFEILPESCFPYQAKDVSCSNRCDNFSNKKKYFVSKYEYLGGYYGATNEELMMKEIRARGPMPGNLLVPFSFSYYKKGIFSFQNQLSKNSGNISKVTIMSENVDWEKVEHSILLVGWGEENGIKYWIGLNTWGTKFGEGGFFRILRGENECNIESMGDALRLRISEE